MYLYSCVYKAVCTYKNVYNRLQHLLCDPWRRLKKDVLPGNAIEEAILINSVGMTTPVYRYGYLTTAYHLFLMWVVFGTEDWMNMGIRNDYCKFRIEVPSVADDEDKSNVLYVRLADGREFLTKRRFDAFDLTEFQRPAGRYLCVMLDSVNITRFYKRFAASWNGLQACVLDIVLLGIALDSQIRSCWRSNLCFAASPTQISLTTIDDESFEEKLYASGEVPVF